MNENLIYKTLLMSRHNPNILLLHARLYR